MNNKIAAHELLERRKRGEPCLPSEIDRALFLTGDLKGTLGFSSERMEESLHETNQREWQTQSINVVARYRREHGEEAWESLCG
jgi:hypothetical protein